MTTDNGGDALLRRRCTCTDCWACEGNEPGCTCDIDWERLYHDDTYEVPRIASQETVR